MMNWEKKGLMKFLRLKKIIIFIVSILSIGTSDRGFAEPNIRLFRFLSYSLRDRPPTIEEAKSFYNGDKNIQEFLNIWMNQDEFLDQRLYRFFNDWFGVGVGLNVINFGHFLLQNEDGVYHHIAKGECELNNAIDAPAWWLEKGETAKFCLNILGETIYFNETAVHCSFPGGNGILNDACGCGPLQILCLPRTHFGAYNISLKEEFAKRGIYAYKNDLNWRDLFVSDMIIGNRYNYHSYLLSGHVVTQGHTLNQNEKDQLMSIPMEGIHKMDSPQLNPERSGVVTSPGFMAQFNNFRSRIRALTEKLLCKDIDGSLNVDGINTFLNPSLSEFDLSHGLKEGCASCHFPMDNLGSTLLNWDSNGFFQGWQNLSQIGWSFGETGEGPQFMMNGFVERAEGFSSCVANRVWEDFTGQQISKIDKSEREQLIEKAKLGPKSIIDFVLTSDLFLNTRKNCK